MGRYDKFILVMALLAVTLLLASRLMMHDYRAALDEALTFVEGLLVANIITRNFAK